MVRIYPRYNCIITVTVPLPLSNVLILFQESTSPTSSPGHGIVIEKVQSFKQSIDESNSTDRYIHEQGATNSLSLSDVFFWWLLIYVYVCVKFRNTDTPISEDSKLAPNAEHDTMPTTLPNMQENVVGDVIPVPNTDLSSSSKTELWKEEDYDAPKREFSVPSRSVFCCFHSILDLSLTLSCHCEIIFSEALYTLVLFESLRRSYWPTYGQVIY